MLAHFLLEVMMGEVEKQRECVQIEFEILSRFLFAKGVEEGV